MKKSLKSGFTLIHQWGEGGLALLTSKDGRLNTFLWLTKLVLNSWTRQVCFGTMHSSIDFSPKLNSRSPVLTYMLVSQECRFSSFCIWSSFSVPCQAQMHPRFPSSSAAINSLAKWSSLWSLWSQSWWLTDTCTVLNRSNTVATLRKT